MDLLKAFGESVKAKRISKNLSQEKFSLLIQMDRTYYASVESGQRNISLKNIEKIISGLGSTYEEIFKDIDKERVEQDVNDNSIERSKHGPIRMTAGPKYSIQAKIKMREDVAQQDVKHILTSIRNGLFATPKEIQNIIQKRHDTQHKA